VSAEELRTGSVIRLAKVGDDFPSDSHHPRPGHFVPSTPEREIEDRTGILLISVFDRSRTTVAQARQIRRAEGEFAAFELDVIKICSIEIPESNPLRSLRVVRDPIEPELAAMPGANGHCGIEGLGKKPCPVKSNRKKLRSKLCDIAVRLPD
jgi:hypothetical protein